VLSICYFQKLGSVFVSEYVLKNYGFSVIHFWHAPLGLRSAEHAHQSPEWTILSHVNFQLLHSARACWISVRINFVKTMHKQYILCKKPRSRSGARGNITI